MIGQTISHYKITAKLGEGGMGVVYKAEDTSLGRPVALKFLAAHLIKDEEARKRFEREARAAAALQHPNICTIHEIGEAGDQTFLAMAFIDGESLESIIAKGPLAIPKALDISQQIAKGLQAAHEKRIVHRDIKPANAMVDAHGHVTVMDFGLALLTEGSKLTQLDSRLGTVAYMSPEQAQGMEVDHRTDIWALGCVLHEMVCGQRPFKGQYDQALFYEIVQEEPEPLTAVRTGVPMELDWIIEKALAKDAAHRYQHAQDIAVDLANLHDKLRSGKSRVMRSSVLSAASASTAGTSPSGSDAASEVGAQRAAPVASGTDMVGARAQHAAPLRDRRFRLVSAALAAALVALAVLAFMHFRQAPPDIPVTELTLDLPPGARLHTYSLSPDGRHVAIALDHGQSGRRLWVRSLDTLEPREFAGTEGAQYPFWSPDSRQIGFFAQGKLKRVSVAGGPPQSLCDAEDGRGGTWNTAGVIVFSPSPFGQIHRVPEGGGEPVALTKANESGAQPARRFPWFLPDGQHFLYTESVAGSDEIGIHLGSVDGTDPRRLLPDDSKAVYATGAGGRGGFILFSREGSLMAQPFDESRLAVAGDAFPVAESIGQAANASNFGISVSSGGSLLYVRGGAGLWAQSQLAWFDREGKQLEMLGKPVSLVSLSLSPDGTRAALSIAQPPTRPDMWLFEFARGTMSRFTTDPGSDITPEWSPDGGQIAFNSQRPDGYHIYLKETSGAQDEQSLVSSADSSLTGRIPRLNDWSPDGRFLLYQVQQPRTVIDLWVLPLEGDRKPYAYLESEFSEENGRFSPDGRWVAYASDESGRMEIYVRPFPAADRKWQISTQGGNMPVWSRNGRELYYIDPEVNLMSVPVEADGAIEAGSPQALFEVRFVERPIAAGTRLYDVSRDGRFLIANRVGDEQPLDERKLILLSDWRAKVAK